jgi:hypothetical protein
MSREQGVLVFGYEDGDVGSQQMKWKYKPVRAFLPSLTFTFHPERTDVWSVPLVVWCCSC